MNAVAHSHFCPETGPPEAFTAEEQHALAAVFDFPHLVLLGLQGEREALHYVREELDRLVREGNTHVLKILAKYGLEEARAILCPNND